MTIEAREKYTEYSKYWKSVTPYGSSPSSLQNSKHTIFF